VAEEFCFFSSVVVSFDSCIIW